MYYVYVLRSAEDGRLYVGQTNDLKRRIKEHQRGKTRSTKHRKELRLIFYEAFLAREDAARRERYLKNIKR